MLAAAVCEPHLRASQAMPIRMQASERPMTRTLPCNLKLLLAVSSRATKHLNGPWGQHTPRPHSSNELQYQRFV